MIKKFHNFVLFDICDDDIRDWKFDGCDFVRIYLPAKHEIEIKMQNNGFYFADRVIDVDIKLNKIEKFEKIRFEIKSVGDKYKNNILQLALNAFYGDRRFYISPFLNKEVAIEILSDFICKTDEIFACFYKEQIIGFIAPQMLNDNEMFVRLACVDEKYRISGASISLYTKILMLAKERGCKKLSGQISTLNSNAINIYTSFHANFSKAKDIFLKDLRTNV